MKPRNHIALALIKSKKSTSIHMKSNKANRKKQKDELKKRRDYE